LAIFSLLIFLYYTGFSRGNSLSKTEQEGHVGVDAFPFQFLGGLNTFPSASNFEQYALGGVDTSS